MATNRRLAGIAQIAIDGTNYDLVGEVIWSPSDRKRETLVGVDKVHGYSEQVVAGFIACKLRDNGATAAYSFQQMTDVTVQLTLANGKVVGGNGMWNTDAVEVENAEGTFAVRFEGDSVSEDLATSS
jgi:hypothetical protein